MTNLLTALWAVSVGSMLVSLWVWYKACKHLRRLDEWHHVYIGATLQLVPWHLFLWWPLAVVLWALGWWISWDDAHLHERQARWWRPGDRQLRGHDDSGSFWHRLAHKRGVI